MCEWGDTVPLVPAHLAWEGVDTVKVKTIDRCIAPLVRALNDAGLITVASCCGHGRQPPNIILADGREVFVAPNFETGRRIAKQFAPIAADGPLLADLGKVTDDD